MDWKFDSGDENKGKKEEEEFAAIPVKKRVILSLVWPIQETRSYRHIIRVALKCSVLIWPGLAYLGKYGYLACNMF